MRRILAKLQANFTFKQYSLANISIPSKIRYVLLPIILKSLLQVLGLTKYSDIFKNIYLLLFLFLSHVKSAESLRCETSKLNLFYSLRSEEIFVSDSLRTEYRGAPYVCPYLYKLILNQTEIVPSINHMRSLSHFTCIFEVIHLARNALFGQADLNALARPDY